MRRRDGKKEPCPRGNETSGSDGLHTQCGGCPHVSGDSSNAFDESGPESSPSEPDDGRDFISTTAWWDNARLVDQADYLLSRYPTHIVNTCSGHFEGINNDMVNHPSHYSSDKIECIEAIEAQLTKEEYRGFLKGNVAKYLWREKYKGGTESLEKAQWYLARLVELN